MQNVFLQTSEKPLRLKGNVQVPYRSSLDMVLVLLGTKKIFSVKKKFKNAKYQSSLRIETAIFSSKLHVGTTQSQRLISFGVWIILQAFLFLAED